jgi:hypothetical protein
MLGSGCDRTHDITIQNDTEASAVEVLFSSDYSDTQLPAETVSWKGRRLQKFRLAPGEKATIGTVQGKYAPGPADVNLEYLEIHYNSDTMILNGKHAIFNLFQKEGSRSWKYLVQDRHDAVPDGQNKLDF